MQTNRAAQRTRAGEVDRCDRTATAGSRCSAAARPPETVPRRGALSRWPRLAPAPHRRGQQVVRRLAGAVGGVLRDRRGPGPCAGRRERRGQVDAGQDHHRHPRRRRRDASLLDGEAVRFATPIEARRAGVAAVYQDPKLFPHLDVAENIAMGDPPLTAARHGRPQRDVRRAPATRSGSSASRSTRGR